MNVQRIAAFADGNKGGNPAGVLISDVMPAVKDMQQIAADVGYSETAFAMQEGDGWRVRYFSPESEVPFCGHATIGLGATLAKQNGSGVFHLQLNDANITVEGQVDGDTIYAALQSPPTLSHSADNDLLKSALDLFGIEPSQLDDRIPAGFAHAGANHLIIMLNSRESLASMQYDLNAGRTLMNENNLVTILLGYAESNQAFHTRNAFASGGVYEDPATGAASAALAGYLRDINWPHGNEINIVQGEDMGSRSLINATFTDEVGGSIRVSGATRTIDF